MSTDSLIYPTLGSFDFEIQSQNLDELSSEEFLQLPMAQKLPGFMAALLARCRLHHAEGAASSSLYKLRLSTPDQQVQFSLSYVLGTVPFRWCCVNY